MLSGIPERVGEHRFTVTATNAAGVGRREYVLFVTPPTPNIHHRPLVQVPPGCDFVERVAVGNATEWFDATGLPPGLELDPATGVISGVAMIEGEYPVSLVASNRYGVSYGRVTMRVSPVIGWGSNDGGPLDIPPDLGEVTAIAAGHSHVMALKADGTVMAWGRGWDQAQGRFFDLPPPPPDLNQVVAIAAGYAHRLALRADGTVVKWGTGQGFPPESGPFAAIAAGYGGSLALRPDGSLVARQHPLGTGGLSNLVSVSVYHDHTLALRADGTVREWSSGGDAAPRDLSNVVAVAAGAAHGLALHADGTVSSGGAWHNSNLVRFVVLPPPPPGLLGEGQVFPSPPPGLSNVVAIAAGERHALALRADGTVVAWGDNSHGQTNVPPGQSNVVAIAAAGYDQAPAALRADGRVVLWTDTSQFSPPLSNIVAIAPGRALDAEGRLFSLSWSDQVQILQSNVVAMSGNFALLADGTVTCAGTSSGYLSSLRNVIAVASGGDPSLFLVSECPALLSDGAVGPGTRVRLVAPLMPGQRAFRQWYHNGVPVPGATGPVLELPAVRPEDLGTYTVQSHWPFATLTHARITLRFVPGLHLFAEPAELVLSPGQEATLHVRVVQAGPDPATATELTGDWSPAFNVLDATAGQGVVRWSAGQFTAALGELPAGTTAEVRVRLRAVSAGEGIPLLRLRSDIALDEEWPGVFAVVTAPPVLAVEPLEYGPALSWPVVSGFHLEQTRSLTPPVRWERVASQPNLAGDRFQYRLPFEGGPYFYRLVRP